MFMNDTKSGIHGSFLLHRDPYPFILKWASLLNHVKYPQLGCKCVCVGCSGTPGRGILGGHAVRHGFFTWSPTWSARRQDLPLHYFEHVFVKRNRFYCPIILLGCCLTTDLQGSKEVTFSTRDSRSGLQTLPRSRSQPLGVSPLTSSTCLNFPWARAFGWEFHI